jgi:hypothetical protein
LKYEEVLKERERNNPKYAFLIHRNVGCPFLVTLLSLIVLQHRRHAFYRGLMESDRVLKPEFDDEVSGNWHSRCKHLMIEYRGIILFIPLILPRSQKENEVVEANLESWRGNDSRRCSEECRASEVKSQGAWHSALNTLKQRMR